MTRDEIVEVTARGIYASWFMQPGYVPWVERGNSDKQDEARRMARSAVSAQEAAGLVVVPKEPTRAMLNAMAGYTDFVYHEQIPDHAAQMEEMACAWSVALRYAADPKGLAAAKGENCDE
jgi:hypothetical protein